MGIQNKTGKIDISIEQIAQHFHDFYTSLYNLPNQHKPADIQDNRCHSEIFKRLQTSHIITRWHHTTWAPIDSSEIIQAIEDLKAGKSPDTDGFSAIYYKTFLDILTKPLIDSLKSLSKLREVPTDFLSAFITVIPKPNKHPTHCTSYCLI